MPVRCFYGCDNAGGEDHAPDCPWSRSEDRICKHETVHQTFICDGCGNDRGPVLSEAVDLESSRHVEESMHKIKPDMTFAERAMTVIGSRTPDPVLPGCAHDNIHIDFVCEDCGEHRRSGGERLEALKTDYAALLLELKDTREQLATHRAACALKHQGYNMMEMEWSDMKAKLATAEANVAEEHDRGDDYEALLAAEKMRSDEVTTQLETLKTDYSGLRLELKDTRAQLEALKEADKTRLANVWDSDKPLPEDDAIRAAHPTQSKNHARYAEAMRLVGAKHSKYALVDLVNWLLSVKA